ncbi:MAG: phosphate ABC transporter permease subunit PstC [Gemmataceae bacterium]
MPRSVSWIEVLFKLTTRSAGMVIVALVVSLSAVLVVQSWPVLIAGGEFQLLTSSQWMPKPPEGQPVRYGSLAFIFGTAITSLLAMAVALPLSIGAAAYMSEIAPQRVRKIGMFLIELLAAIPSVVYGFWGLFFLAPAVQWVFNQFGGPNTGGNGILSAGLILAVMILPYITAISFDVCQSVPRSQREGALALGATRWQTIFRVVLPYARPGIIAASFLALGRALGETMAVTMLIGNKEEMSLSPFALGDTIASRIANQLNEADEPNFRAALVALGLVLMLVTAVFNISARFLLGTLTKMRPKPAPVEPPDPPKPQTNGNGNSTGHTISNGAGSGTTVPSTSRVVVDPAALPLEPPRVSVRSRAQLWDRVMTGVLFSTLVATVVPLFLIIGFIVIRGSGALNAQLFVERGRSPLTNEQFKQYQEAVQLNAEMPTNELGRPLRRGGLGHAMLGSVLMVTMATIVAVPLALLAAIYLAEAGNALLARSIRFLAEILGGVPSIIIGIFAYAILVAPTYGALTGRTDPLGANAFAGAFALAVMMIPIIVRTAEESMKLVPNALRQASYALGANRMQTTLKVVVPASLPAIVTGIFLAIGRIAGETAPLLLTAGGNFDFPKSPRDQTAFLPGNIYTYSRSPFDDWQEQAWGGALVLLAMVMLLNIGVRLLAGKRVVAASRAD